VQQASAQLKDLLTRQALMTIRAPVSGRVLERTIRPGDVASLSTVMFRIARGGLVELNAELPEADLARVAPGSHAEVEVPSGSRVTGVIRLISPMVDPQTRLGRVRILLPVRPDLRPGGFGRAVFGEAIRPSAAVPESAIRFDASGASVMLVDAQNRVHRQPVRTGQRAGGYVELLQGPPPGALVALGGGAFVLEGDHVRPVFAGAPAATGRKVG
jgi:HlyD family secretion protein